MVIEGNRKKSEFDRHFWLINSVRRYWEGSKTNAVVH